MKICSSPEIFYFWIFEPPKKRPKKFWADAFKKNKTKQKNKEASSNTCSVSAWFSRKAIAKGAALKAGIRNPESGSRGILQIQQLDCTKIVSRKP